MKCERNVLFVLEIIQKTRKTPHTTHKCLQCADVSSAKTMWKDQLKCDFDDTTDFDLIFTWLCFL